MKRSTKEDYKELILMHKRTGSISILMQNTWFGNIINYGEWPDNSPIARGPFLFDDDPKFNLDQYEILGEL